MSRSILTIALVLSATAGLALADNAHADNTYEGKTLFGDMGGLRTDWAAKGITLRGDLVVEGLGVTEGGYENGFRTAEQIRIGVDFDMKKLAGWSGGAFHFTLNDRRGESTSADLVGNRFPIQEAYGGLYARITEMSYDQSFFDGKTYVKAGFYAMGNGYAVQTLGTNFVNAAFCAHPLSLSGDSGWYNYPNARWGLEVMQKLTPEVSVRTGVFQVNPELGQQGNAFKPWAGDTTGQLYPVEINWTPGSQTSHPGNYKFGGYYDTSTASRLGLSGTQEGRYGYWFMGEQKIFAEKANPKRGLSVFAQYLTHDRATSQIWNWYGLGAVYQGTFKGRDQDKIALGWISGTINPRLIDQQRASLISAGVTLDDARYNLTKAETVWELSYSYQVNPWLMVRPDVQYVVNPGTFNFKQTPDATVIGLQTKVTF
ncbi:MAG: carbohydrate porin [Asticcacaulis sp.]|uniref:carbohydrate porin n=1 Tax=Asticcacaulis sp. TaxID=1872648 RepID=UPI0039E462A1